MRYRGFLVLCVACGEPAIDTGLTIAGDGSSSSRDCGVFVTETLGLDDPLADGTTVGEAIAFLTVGYEMTPTWADAGQRPLALSAEVLATEVTASRWSDCPDRDTFSTDVTFRMSTGDGLLDETWTVRHRFSTPWSQVGISGQFAPSELEGSFDAEDWMNGTDELLLWSRFGSTVATDDGGYLQTRSGYVRGGVCAWGSGMPFLTPETGTIDTGL